MLNSTKEDIYDEIRINSLTKKIHKIDISDGIRLEFNLDPNLWMEIVTMEIFSKFEIKYSLFEKSYPIRELIDCDKDGVISEVQNWLENVNNWIEEQSYDDPWEKKYKKFKLPKELSEGIAKMNFQENKPFSEREKKLIQDDLEMSKAFIKDLDLPEDRYKILEVKLDLLAKAVENNNKMTWLKLGKEVIISAIINAATGWETLLALSALFGKLLKIPYSMLGLKF